MLLMQRLIFLIVLKDILNQIFLLLNSSEIGQTGVGGRMNIGIVTISIKIVCVQIISIIVMEQTN